MLLIAMFAFGALVWGVYLLGSQCFGWAAGALAAFVVATREPFLSQGVRAYVDVPFLALVVAAAVLEAQARTARNARARAAGAGRPAAARGVAARGGVRGVAVAGTRARAAGRGRWRWRSPRRCCGR